MTVLISNPWFVYLIRLPDNSLYTGITTDIARRFVEHQRGNTKSAKYLRGKGPLQLAYQYEVGDRATALKLEYKIKRLSKDDKEALVCGNNTGLLKRLGIV